MEIEIEIEIDIDIDIYIYIYTNVCMCKVRHHSQCKLHRAPFEAREKLTTPSSSGASILPHS